jgi:hypothetical protein
MAPIYTLAIMFEIFSKITRSFESERELPFEPPSSLIGEGAKVYSPMTSSNMVLLESGRGAMVFQMPRTCYERRNGRELSPITRTTLCVLVNVIQWIEKSSLQRSRRERLQSYKTRKKLFQKTGQGEMSVG